MKMAIEDLNSPEGMFRKKTGDRKGELSETGSDVLFLVFIKTIGYLFVVVAVGLLFDSTYLATIYPNSQNRMTPRRLQI